MNEAFIDTFEAAFHAERVSEPECAEKRICYPGAITDAWVEGVSVEFYPDKAEPWFATFAGGGVSPNAANFAGSHPNKTHAVVVSKGEGYVVNVSDPNDWEELSIRPIMGVAVDKSTEVLVLWDFVRMLCLDGNGVRWQTPSISWDGIKDVSILGDCVQATIWDAPTAKNVIAKIAIADGSLLHGASSPELLGIR